MLSALLILALALPTPSAQALRTLNAGAEESPVQDLLENALQSAAGVEEKGKEERGGYLDALVKVMDELLKARKEEEVAAAVEGFVQETLGYDGVALYLVEPPVRWDEPFMIRSQFRLGFKGPSSAETLGPAAYEKEWALRDPSPDGDLQIDRWNALGGLNAKWVNREALQKDARLYGGKDRVRSAYYYTVKNLGVPSLLVLIQNWESGRPLFQGETDLEKAESRRRVRETLTTLGRAFLLAMENVRSYRRSEEMAKMAGPLHALKNALGRVTSRSELLELDLDPEQHRDISQLNREIQSLSFALAQNASSILDGLRNGPQPSDRSPASPLSLNEKDLAPFAGQIHDLAGELMEPVRRGDAETLQKRIAETETEILAQIHLTKREELDALDPERQLEVQPVRVALSVLDRWMTLGSLAIAARQELRGETEKWVPQLRSLMGQTGMLVKLGEKLQAAEEQVPTGGDAQDGIKIVVDRVSKLPEEMERFVQEFGAVLGVEPERLTAPGPRDLVAELRSAVESSVAWQDGHVRYEGPRISGGVISRWPVDPQRAALAANTLAELLHNTWKYRRGNKLRVEVTVRFDPLTNRLNVTVEDNGVGIPRVLRSSLFQMGNRLNRPEIQNIEGTGFGLATLRMELEKEGGGLELVKSRAIREVPRAREAGSTFRFWIPIQDSPEEAIPLDLEGKTVPAHADSKPSWEGQPASAEVSVFAGVEEMEEFYLRERMQGLYLFPGLVQKHFGENGARAGSWAAFLKEVRKESSMTVGSAFNPWKWKRWMAAKALGTLPTPLRISVEGELVLHNQREGVLVLGENGAEPSLLAIFMTGDQGSGWSSHSPLEWIVSDQKNRHTWTYLGGNGDLLVLEFPQGLYAGRRPRPAGDHLPLTTRFPLLGADEVPVHEREFEGRAFRTKIKGRDEFVRLKGVVRFSRRELLTTRQTLALSEPVLPVPLQRLPDMPIVVELTQHRWRTDWDKDPDWQKAVADLQAAVQTVEDFFVSRLSSGVEEVQIGELRIPKSGLALEGLTVQATGEIAVGLEEYLTPGETAMAVPVADQRSVGTLLLSPGIREVQASLADAGIIVKRVGTPEESRQLLETEPVGLLILAPEDAAKGDWRGTSGVPAVVMPALAAAGLEERQLAAIAEAAQAHGGILYVNEMTQTGAEEKILILRTAA
ncbi:MAG: hypothetical protein HYZ88_00710 [Candidatus Omnitrophica bacterium]|nr:hypothetical protein [Candidatus Omnitrophota bacterium]